MPFELHQLELRTLKCALDCKEKTKKKHST